MHMERTATLHNNELLDLSMQEDNVLDDENYVVVDEDEGSNTNFDDFEIAKGTSQRNSQIKSTSTQGS